MNIGEISKPSVDRTQIKKTFKTRLTDPVAPSKAVSDLVELSEEARHKYEEDKAKDLQRKKRRHLIIDDEGETTANPSIDLEA